MNEGASVNPWVALAYLVAGICFILALRGLSSPASSRRGNRFGMAGMVLAVGTTLVTHGVASLYEIAARHAGIRTRTIKTVLFATLGVVSALAGMMFVSQLGTVRYDLGLGGELQMVLMAMLGGTYIFGGRGSILGTFLAGWLLSIMTNAMNTASWLPATQFCLLGVLLIVSIIVTNFIYSRTQR